MQRGIRITDTVAMILLNTSKTLFFWPYIGWSLSTIHDDETDCIVLNRSYYLRHIRFSKFRVWSCGREPESERGNLAVPRYSYDS